MKQAIPEDVIIDILRRLPISQCIARFQCVCKSWRDLLSDPSFTLRHKSADSGLQIMINFADKDNRSVYSLYSADTLEPLLPSPVPLPQIQGPLSDSHVAGCCNGLICISHGAHLMLWNPATSETKIIPPSPSNGPVGFGFDPEMNDYKIIRQVYITGGASSEYRCFLGVYSLRNDSWTILSGVDDDVDDDGFEPRLPPGRIPQYNKGKLYWWNVRYMDNERSLLFDSFDMSREQFQELDLPYPRHCGNAYGRPECSLKEEAMVALFTLYDDVMSDPTSWEVWVLLKYWVSESWTKSVVITMSCSPPPHPRGTNIVAGSFGISRDLKGLLVAVRSNKMRSGYYHDKCLSFIGFRSEMGEFSDLGLDIWLKGSLIVIDYTPSQV